MGSLDRDRRISRRDFLKIAGASGGGVVLAAAFPQEVAAQSERQLLGMRMMSLGNRHSNTEKNEIWAKNILLAVSRITPLNAERLKQDPSFYGSIKIEPNGEFSFVRKAGPTLTEKEGYLSDGYLPADGVCHLASLMYWVIKDTAVLEQLGIETNTVVTHSTSIPEIPNNRAVSILSTDPRQDLVIKNGGKGTLELVFKYIPATVASPFSNCLLVEVHLVGDKLSTLPAATPTPSQRKEVSPSISLSGQFEYGKIPEGFTHNIKLEGVRLPDWAVWATFQLYRRYKGGSGVTKLPVDMIPFLLGLKVSETGPDSGFIGTTNFNGCLSNICKTQGPAAETIASWVGVDEFLAVVNEYPRGRGVKAVLYTPCSVAGAFGPFQFLPTTAKAEIEKRMNWDKAAAFVVELKELGLLKPRVREIKQFNPLNYTDALALAWLHTTTLGMRPDGTNFHKWNNSAVQKNKVVRFYAIAKAGLDRLLRDAIQ